MINVSIEANGVEPDQTAPTGAVWSGSTLFDQKVSKTFQQITKADRFCCDWCYNKGFDIPLLHNAL